MARYRVDIDAFNEVLDERAMNLRDLAQASGLSYSFIKYLANGQRNPRASSARYLAQALGVPLDRFIVVEQVGPRRPASRDPNSRGTGVEQAA